MKDADARAALRAELARRPDGPQFDDYPADIRDRLAKLLVNGSCTVLQAVEALTVARELGDAVDVPVEHGLALMTRLGDRHAGKTRRPN